jgi:hypothetical protein
MQRYTNELVMFIGISIAFGGLFSDFKNNPQLISSITFSAVCFSLFDLVVSMSEKSYKTQKTLLFLGIFSVIVVPYLTKLSPVLIAYNNYFTLFGLAIVIFLIGFRQNKQELKDLKKLKQNFDKQSDIIREQNEIINQQSQIIKYQQEFTNQNEIMIEKKPHSEE